MADTKITALTAISTVDPAIDVLPIVDVSDTTMAASGTTKKITSNQILGAGGTATLASATITGDLTVDTNTLKVDSAGNRVIIGATSVPDTFLKSYITDAAAGTVGIGTGFSASAGYQGTWTNHPYVIAANGTEQLRVAPLGVFTFSDGAGGTRMTLNSTGLGVANGNVIIGTSGKGIDFSATASGSGTMTSELLNDYEEGTFTPGITFGGASVAMTGNFYGRYTKVGRAVTVSGLIVLSAKGSSTGTALITGLPFTSSNGAGSYASVSTRLSKISFTDTFQGFIGPSATTINLEQITNAGVDSALTDANFPVGLSVLIWNATYDV